MRRFFYISIGLLFLAGLVGAQLPGQIAVFSDPQASSCDFAGTGPVQVHYYHLYHDGTWAVKFKLATERTDWIFLHDQINYHLIYGTSANGIAISYERCETGPTYLGSGHFFGSGATVPCSLIEIVPFPGEDNIWRYDCRDVLSFPTGRRGVVDPDASCRCSPPVPVVSSTWGAIKSLYKGE